MAWDPGQYFSAAACFVLVIFVFLFMLFNRLISRNVPQPGARDPQHDLTNMIILFQTMRDLIRKQKDLAKDSDDKYLEKKFNDVDGGTATNDVLLDEENHRFTMKPGDYGNAYPGKYHLVIAIKITGLTEMIELQMKDDNIIIVPDKNRA